MYISLNGTLTAGGKLSWEEFAHLAHNTGYPGVDVRIDAAIQAGSQATIDLLRGSALKPAVVGLPVEFRKDEATFAEGLAKLPEAARFSAGIGCPRMTTYLLPSSDLPKPELRRILKDRFTRMAQAVAPHGIRLGIEFVSPVHLRKRFQHEFIYRMDEMLEFALECGPNMGVLLDSWHWHHAGGTLKDIEAAGKKYIIHVQVADARNLPPDKILDSERLMPGEGIIDLVAFFRTLQKIGYEDGVSPEVFGRGLRQMPPVEGALLGLETTAKVMKKAGVL